LVQTDEERKAKDKARRQTPEYKAQAKEQGKKYRERNKEKLREYAKKYRESPEGKAKDKARKQTPEYKAQAKKANKKYHARPEVKERERKRYEKHSSDPEKLTSAKNERDVNRLKILKYYSKSLSNSNIPCCNCCGENSHVDFLAIDHIRGSKQMDLEPELKKLKYSSKLRNQNLHRWILKNDFPDGFQILCTNCNFAKGMKKNNNQCPHERIRKEETFAMMEEQSSFEV